MVYAQRVCTKIKELTKTSNQSGGFLAVIHMHQIEVDFEAFQMQRPPIKIFKIKKVTEHLYHCTV